MVGEFGLNENTFLYFILDISSLCIVVVSAVDRKWAWVKVALMKQAAQYCFDYQALDCPQ